MSTRPKWTGELPEWIHVWDDFRIGYYPSGAKGKGARKVVRGGKSWADVERRVRQIRAEVQAGMSLKVDQDATWTTLCAAWAAQHADNIPEGTYRLRLSAINSHILPAIGSVRLVETDSTTLNAIIESFLETSNGQSRFKVVIQTLRVIEGWARRKKWVIPNCFGSDSDVREAISSAEATIITRKGIVDHDDVSITMADVPTKADVEALAKAVQEIAERRIGVKGSGLRYARAIRVAAASGLRMCELLGLTVDKVDLKNGFIMVDHQLDRYVSWAPNEPMPTAPPKSRRKRKVRVWRSAERDLRALVNEAGPDGVLLPPINNASWWADQWGHLLAEAIKECGWRWTPHYLRHHYGSYSTAAKSRGGKGMDYPTVQKSLGHASLKTTLDTYIHSTASDESGWA